MNKLKNPIIKTHRKILRKPWQISLPGIYVIPATIYSKYADVIIITKPYK